MQHEEIPSCCTFHHVERPASSMKGEAAVIDDRLWARETDWSRMPLHGA